MTNFIRKLALRALVTLSAVTAPWVALAAYNILQNPNGSTCFADASESNAVLCFFAGRAVRNTAPDGTGPELWTFDQKEYTLYLADLGTAGSALIAIDVTGKVVRVSTTWGTTLTSASAVMSMYRFTAASLATNGNFAAQAASTRVAAFSITAPTTSVNGGRVADDTIFQTVGMGDVIAVDTDGGPGNAVPGYITLTIRATGAQ